VYFRYLLWATFGLSAVRFAGVSDLDLDQSYSLISIVLVLLDHPTAWTVSFPFKDEAGLTLRRCCRRN